MLEILMKGRHPRSETVVSQLSITELMRTIRPMADGAVFIEPAKDTLLNLCHVERITELSDEEPGLTTEEAVGALEDEAEQAAAVNVVGTPAHGWSPCPHGFIQGTCEECKRVAQETEQGQPRW